MTSFNALILWILEKGGFPAIVSAADEVGGCKISRGRDFSDHMSPPPQVLSALTRRRDLNGIWNGILILSVTNDHKRISRPVWKHLVEYGRRGVQAEFRPD